MKEQHTAVLLIWDRIGDYHLSRVKACESILEQDIYTADLAGTDALYKWNSIENKKHTVLSDRPAEERDVIKRFKAFKAILKQYPIGIVAMPYGRTEYHLFLLYARLNGVRTIVFSESWYTRGGWKDYLKAIFLKTIGNYFFVSGARAYEHFKNTYNIKPVKLSSGYSVIDNNHFSQVNKVAQEKKQIICVARYSEEKNLAFLIRCFNASTISKEYTLLLVGDGPQREALQQLIDSLKLAGKAKLLGWVTYNELPALYAASSCFVLPSIFEPWGLVVNEAMAAGLPILISTACGCFPELLKEGKNGFAFDAQNETSLIGVFDTFASLSESDRQNYGKSSSEIIQGWTPHTWATEIKTIINS